MNARCTCVWLELLFLMQILVLSDIDDPIISSGGAPSIPEPSVEQVNMLCDMGFTSAQAKKALRETVSTEL